MGHGNYGCSNFTCLLLMLFVTSSIAADQFIEAFASCTLQYWSSDVNSSWRAIHASDVGFYNDDMLLSIELETNKEARLYFKQTLNENVIVKVNITIQRCDVNVFINVSGTNVMLQDGSCNCTDNAWISLVYNTTVTTAGESEMTLTLISSRNTSSSHLILISGLDVVLETQSPSSSKSLEKIQWLEDFSSRKLQYWTGDTDDGTWYFETFLHDLNKVNDTLLVLELDPKFPSALYFKDVLPASKPDLKDAHLTVNVTILGCNSVIYVYWRDYVVLVGPIDDTCSEDYMMNLEFTTHLTDLDNLNLMLLAYGPRNESLRPVLLISRLEVLLETKRPTLTSTVKTAVTFADLKNPDAEVPNNRGLYVQLCGPRRGPNYRHDATRTAAWVFIVATSVLMVTTSLLIALICKRRSTQISAFYHKLRTSI